MVNMCRPLRKSLVALCTIALVLTQYPRSLQSAPLEERLAAYDYFTGQLEPINQLLTYLGTQLDRSIYETKALSEALGGEPAAIFEFLRDEIEVRAYSGSLRGPDGVLIDRTGNALDRSLLLARLLDHAGIENRIAHGTLHDDLAERIGLRSFEPAPEAPDVLNITPELLAALMETFKMSAEEVERGFLSSFEGSAAAADEIMAIYGPAADQLISDMGESAPDSFLGFDFTSVTAEHYWVQYRDESGAWINLDAILPEMQPGEQLVEAQEVFEPDALPTELFHRVGVTITLEIRDGSAIEEIVLIDESLSVPSLAGDQIIVANIPDALADMPLNAGKEWGAVTSEINEYTTVLKVDDYFVSSPYFTLDGRIFNSAPGSDEGNAERTREAIGGATDSATDVLSNLFSVPDDTTDEPAATGRRVVGQSVTYTILESQGLGREPVKRELTRDIFSPESVTAWDPTSSTATSEPIERSDLELHTLLAWGGRIAPIGSTVTGNYIAYRQLAFIAESQTHQDMQMRAMLELPDAAGASAPVEALPWLAYTLVSTAHDLDPRIGESSPDAAMYMATPTVIVEEMRLGGSPEFPTIREGVDIVALGQRAAFIDSDARLLAFDRVVREGVLWTTLERTLHQDKLERAGLDAPVANLTHVFANAVQQGHGFRLLPPDSGSDGLGDVAIDAALRHALARELENGNIVMFPESEVADDAMGFAWWRVDPDTGETIGVAPDGRGATFAEWALQMERAADPVKFDSYVLTFHIMFSVFTGMTVFVACLAIRGSDQAGICFGTGLAAGLGVSPIPVASNMALVILGFLFFEWAAQKPPSTAPSGSGSTAQPDSSSTATPDSSSTAQPDSNTDSQPDADTPEPPATQPEMTEEDIKEFIDNLVRDMTLGPYQMGGQ